MFYACETISYLNWWNRNFFDVTWSTWFFILPHAPSNYLIRFLVEKLVFHQKNFIFNLHQCQSGEPQTESEHEIDIYPRRPFRSSLIFFAARSLALYAHFHSGHAGKISPDIPGEWERKFGKSARSARKVLREILYIPREATPDPARIYRADYAREEVSWIFAGMQKRATLCCTRENDIATVLHCVRARARAYCVSRAQWHFQCAIK